MQEAKLHKEIGKENSEMALICVGNSVFVVRFLGPILDDTHVLITRLHAHSSTQSRWKQLIEDGRHASGLSIINFNTTSIEVGDLTT